MRILQKTYLVTFLLFWSAICILAEVNWNDHKSCKECHPTIYKEWETTRHYKAWTSKQFKTQSQNRTKEDCLPCHAPKPYFETGIDKDIVLREKDRESGVNCITCHRQSQKALGPYKDSKGDCNPAYSDKFIDNSTCKMCHLNTSDEWTKSTYSKKGSKNYSTCAKCHMKPVKRAAAKDGKIREVFQHLTYGGHDLKALQESVRNLSVKVDKGKVRITLTNDLVGHTLPSGTVGRQLLIMTAIKDDDEKTVAFHRKVFEKGDNKDKKDTSIPPDKKITLTYDAKLDEGEVIVRVLYKMTPTVKDRKATIVTEKRESFGE
jgi:hypothetical protein